MLVRVFDYRERMGRASGGKVNSQCLPRADKYIWGEGETDCVRVPISIHYSIRLSSSHSLLLLLLLLPFSSAPLDSLFSLLLILHGSILLLLSILFLPLDSLFSLFLILHVSVLFLLFLQFLLGCIIFYLFSFVSSCIQFFLPSPCSFLLSSSSFILPSIPLPLLPAILSSPFLNPHLLSVCPPLLFVTFSSSHHPLPLPSVHLYFLSLSFPSTLFLSSSSFFHSFLHFFLCSV